MSDVFEKGASGEPEQRAARRLVELSRAECVTLLEHARFGRVAVTLGAGAPAIRPVNYAWDDASHSVVFRAVPGSKLYALGRSSRASFEIDAMDEASRTGWSVIVHGAVERVTAAADIRRLEALGLETWVAFPESHWVRIRAGTVTGRRIVCADDVAGEGGGQSPAAGARSIDARSESRSQHDL